MGSLVEEISAFLRSHPEEPTPLAPGGGGPGGLRVILPYSGSGAAERAVAAMIQLAPSLRAEVRVLHVREFETCRGARFFLTTQGEALRLVDGAVSQLRRRGVAATGVVRPARWGDAAGAIVDEARRAGASLILLGAHRRRLVDRLRPNVVRRVLRHAPCGVLVVRTDTPPGSSGRTGGRRGTGTGPDLPRAA